MGFFCFLEGISFYKQQILQCVYVADDADSKTPLLIKRPIIRIKPSFFTKRAVLFLAILTIANTHIVIHSAKMQYIHSLFLHAQCFYRRQTRRPRSRINTKKHAYTSGKCNSQTQMPRVYSCINLHNMRRRHCNPPT